MVAQLDEGLDHLAAVLVRNAADRDLGDRRVQVDRLLDHARIDVEAAGDDQVLDPVDQIDVAVLVHVADVAGAQAAEAERLLGLVLALPVAGHDLRAGDADLTLLAQGQHPVRIVERDDLDDGAGQRQAGRVRPAGAGKGVDGHHRRGLGQAVALDQRAARDALELGLDRARQRRPARDAVFEAGEIVVVQRLVLVDRRIDGRHGEEHRRLLLVDHGQRLGDLEARQQQDLRAADERQVHDPGHAEDVEQRQDRQHLLPALVDRARPDPDLRRVGG